MSPIYIYLPALKGLAIAGSLINGGTLTSGYRLLPATYPAVRTSPQDAAKQWEYFYNSMSATVPAVDVATIVAILTVAYNEYQVNSAGMPWKIWATAAGLMPIGWAWVRKVMAAPSNELLAIAGTAPHGIGDVKASSEKTLNVLKEFNAQMSFRMTVPWVVGGLCLWASLGF